MSTHSDRCIHAPGGRLPAGQSPGAAKQSGAIITAHAMVRWLERAEGRDLRPMRAAFVRHRGHDADDGELLQFLSLYTGEPLGDIRARILTPALRAAIALGASKVRRGRVWLVIAGGAVVTVLYRRRSILFRDHSRPGRWHSSKGRQSWVCQRESELCSA